MKKSVFSTLFFLFSYCLSAQDSVITEKIKSTGGVHEITELLKVADSEKYAVTGELPVKVGRGSKGGPANQRAYLELLRDGNGDPVKYKRVAGGCCPYKSENALFGDYALVDSYEVSYKDKDGKKRKVLIYISFYDYEEPMIPVGFQTIAAK